MRELTEKKINDNNISNNNKKNGETKQQIKIKIKSAKQIIATSVSWIETVFDVWKIAPIKSHTLIKTAICVARTQFARHYFRWSIFQVWNLTL